MPRSDSFSILIWQWTGNRWGHGLLDYGSLWVYRGTASRSFVGRGVSTQEGVSSSKASTWAAVVAESLVTLLMSGLSLVGKQQLVLKKRSEEFWYLIWVGVLGGRKLSQCRQCHKSLSWVPQYQAHVESINGRDSQWGKSHLAVKLEAVAPVIWWVNIILEFATSIENASFVIGTHHHIGPRKEAIQDQKWQK